MVFVRSPKRPAVTCCLIQKPPMGQEECFLIKACGCVLEGLSLAWVSTEGFPPVLPHTPAGRIMGNAISATQRRPREALVRRRP